MRSRVYVMVGRPSVCPVVRRRAAGLLPSVPGAGHIDHQLQALAPSAAARRSAANASSVMLIAELTTLNTCINSTTAIDV